MSLIVSPPPVTALPVQGQDTGFPVRRVYCVGRNYGEHAKEMGADPSEPPFFFSKPRDAVSAATAIPYPAQTERLDFEVELVVALQAGGRDLSAADAAAAVGGYAVGIDWTRRDAQTVAKKAGKPWDLAKGFDNSASIGLIVPAAATGVLEAGRIALSIGGAQRQHGDLSDMVLKVPAILAELSRFVTLQPGDLVFTGTPSGVGPIQPGETAVAEIAGLPTLSVTVAATGTAG